MFTRFMRQVAEAAQELTATTRVQLWCIQAVAAVAQEMIAVLNQALSISTTERRVWQRQAWEVVLSARRDLLTLQQARMVLQTKEWVAAAADTTTADRDRVATEDLVGS